MKRRRLTAALLAAAVLCAAALPGCAKGEKNTGGEKEITVAVNSETGTLDPAGSIALTYLSYSVTALDELLTYDENGYVTRLQYASAFRPSVGDADGIYAREYVRDDKGRVLEEHYLGFDGKPKGTKGGLGIRRHTYNDKDEWIRTEYLTSTGEESNDGNGVPIVDLTYDRYGNRIKEVYVNRAGEMVLRTDTGSSGMTYEIDKDGHQVTRAYIGTDGQPCFSKDGCAGYRFK